MSKRINKKHRKIFYCTIIIYTLYILFVSLISIMFLLMLKDSEMIIENSICFSRNFPIFLLGSAAYIPLVAFFVSKNTIFFLISLVSVILIFLGYIGILLKKKKLILAGLVYFLIEIVAIFILNIKYHFYFVELFSATDIYMGLYISIALSVIVDFILFVLCIYSRKSSLNCNENKIGDKETSC